MAERCDTCNARILEMPGEHGRPIRIDPDPSPVGTVRIEKSKAFVLGTGQAQMARESGEQLYVIHPKYCRRART